MESADDSFYLVHADGEVLARTRYEATVEEQIVKKVEKETGRKIEQNGLKINKRGIKFIKDIPFDNYKEYIEEKKLINWEAIDFPIKILTYEYREVELKEIKQDIDFIKQANQIKAIEKINNEIYEGAEIVSKEVVHNIDGNILTTTVYVEAIEEIGKKVIINN
jgi:similar to stage IV sporulation protein